jgi:hypothetical protein
MDLQDEHNQFKPSDLIVNYGDHDEDDMFLAEYNLNEERDPKMKKDRPALERKVDEYGK